MTPPVSTPAAEATRADLREALDRCIRKHLYIGERRWIRELVDVLLDGPLATLTAGKATAEAALAVARAERLPHMCRDDHPEIRHALSDDDERCPVCRERDRATAAEAQAATERARADELAESITAVLDDACRMSSILLMAGEMTAQERRTARAIANGIAAKVRHTLARPNDHHPHGGDDADRT